MGVRAIGACATVVEEARPMRWSSTLPGDQSLGSDSGSTAFGGLMSIVYDRDVQEGKPADDQSRHQERRQASSHAHLGCVRPKPSP